MPIYAPAHEFTLRLRISLICACARICPAPAHRNLHFACSWTCSLPAREFCPAHEICPAPAHEVALRLRLPISLPFLSVDGSPECDPKLVEQAPEPPQLLFLLGNTVPDLTGQVLHPRHLPFPPPPLRQGDGNAQQPLQLIPGIYMIISPTKRRIILIFKRKLQNNYTKITKNANKIPHP